MRGVYFEQIFFASVIIPGENRFFAGKVRLICKGT